MIRGVGCFYIILTILLAPVLGISEELKLGDAVARTLLNNHLLKAETLKLEQLELKKKEAFTSYFPRIDLNAAYTRLNDPVDLNLEPLRQLIIGFETEGRLSDLNLQTILSRGNPLTAAEKKAYADAIRGKLNGVIPSFNIHVLDQDLFRMSLQFSMPIWLGGKVQALNKAARLNIEVGKTELERSREQIIEETARIYLTNKLLEEVLAVYTETEKGVADHYRQAESLYHAGLVAKYQLLRARVALSDFTTRRRQAEENLKTARGVLAVLINVDNLDNMLLSTPLTFRPITKTSDETWKEIRERNPILHQLEIKKQLVKTQKRAHLGDYLPQLYAFGKYEILRDDLSLFDPDWAVGVGMSLKLFSSGERIFKLKSDNRMMAEVTEREKEMEDLLKKLCQKLFHSAESERYTVESYESRFEEAQENIKLAESRFSSGLGISLEVVDAHMMSEKIRVERLQAVYNHTLCRFSLSQLAQNLEQSILELEETK